MSNKRRVALAGSILSVMWLGTVVAAYTPAEAFRELSPTAVSATGLVQITASPDGRSAAVTVGSAEGDTQLLVWLKVSPDSTARFESAALGQTTVVVQGSVATIGQQKYSTAQHPTDPMTVAVIQIGMQPTRGLRVRIPVSVVAAAMAGYGAVMPLGGGDSSNCQGGGPGSGTCGWSFTVAGVTESCTVGCNSGYYACCGNGLFSGMFCNCQSNPPEDSTNQH
jgi:hypothetical protein